MKKRLIATVLTLAMCLGGCAGEAKTGKNVEDSGNLTIAVPTPNIESVLASSEAVVTLELENVTGGFAPSEPAPAPTPHAEPHELAEFNLNGVQPYEVGQIMILMYHGIVEGKPNSSYQRNINDFKNDLQALYDRGFRIMPLSDLLDNNIKVEAGYTPAVLCFDDGVSTSFSLEEANGQLVPKKDCAVDILNEFEKTHPDFGNSAIFYVNADSEPFKGAGTVSERFQYLVDNGYEIGNHTFSHAVLSKLDAEGIQKEVGKVEKYVQDHLPNYKMRSISYPEGVRPKEDFRQFALKGTYEGTTYNYEVGLREGQSDASAAPNHVRFDPTNIPRVRGSNDEETDLWWTLEMYEQKPERRYISDGNPDRILVPDKYKENLNLESANGKQLCIYISE